MATQSELWSLIAEHQEAVLATVRRDGLPQLTNVLYVADASGRALRVSTTGDRQKARNLARDPRAVVHVAGDDFWSYAVAEGRASVSSLATEPDDQVCRELLAVHSALYGELDP